MNNLLNGFEKVLKLCEEDARKVDSQEIKLHRYDMYGYKEVKSSLLTLKENAEKLLRLGNAIAAEGEGIISPQTLSAFREDLEMYWKLADNPHFFPRSFQFGDLKARYIKIKPFVQKKLTTQKVKIKVGEEVGPLAREYLKEAALCLSSNAYRACVVMLGVASEKVLIDLYKSEFGKTNKDIKNKKIFAIIEELKNARKLKDVEKVLADIIRITRNEYGHPKRIDVNIDQVKSFMTSIPKYVNDVYKRVHSV